MESQPTGRSIAEQLKDKETIASGMIKRGQEEHEETKKLVTEHLDELIDDASADYQEAAKKKITEAASKGDFAKAESLSAEIKKHLRDIELEKRKSLPWWKRFPEDWNYDGISEEDFIEADEFVKSSPDRAKEIDALNSMAFKEAEAKMQQLSPLERKVMIYLSKKDELVRWLKNEGRSQEAAEV